MVLIVICSLQSLPFVSPFVVFLFVSGPSPFPHELLWPALQVMLFLREEMKKNEISEARAAVLIWTSVMSCVEWNKKEELVTEQAIKHLKVLWAYPVD